jgi:hypothetical protein
MKLLSTALAATSVLNAADARKQQGAMPAKPAGPVERESGMFYYTGGAGRKWVFRPAPSGLARWEDKAAGPNVKAEDEFAWAKMAGQGAVKVEQPIPFGTYRWEKKQPDLDENETKALRKAQESSLQDK